MARVYNNIFILSGILVILFAGAVYLLLGKGAADALKEQMLHREQVIARAGVASVESFFSVATRSLIGLALNPILTGDPKDAKALLDGYMGRWEGTPVGGILLLDKNGVVITGSNPAGVNSVGVSLADRDYFKWAKTAAKGQYFVSQPLLSKAGATKGHYVVTVVSPVFDVNGKFFGAIDEAVLLSELTDEYLIPLKISDATATFLIDGQGVIIGTSVPKLEGVGYINYLKTKPYPGAETTAEQFENALKSNTEGKIDTVLQEAQTGKLVRYLIAYDPVMIGGNRGILAVATPDADALVYLTPFYFKDLGLAGLAGLAFLLIMIRISKIRGYKEGAEEEHKIHTKHIPHPEL